MLVVVGSGPYDHAAPGQRVVELDRRQLPVHQHRHTRPRTGRVDGGPNVRRHRGGADRLALARGEGVEIELGDAAVAPHLLGVGRQRHRVEPLGRADPTGAQPRRTGGCSGDIRRDGQKTSHRDYGGPLAPDAGRS